MVSIQLRSCIQSRPDLWRARAQDAPKSVGRPDRVLASRAMAKTLIGVILGYVSVLAMYLLIGTYKRVYIDEHSLRFQLFS